MADGCSSSSSINNKNTLDFTFDMIALLLPSLLLCVSAHFSDCFLLILWPLSPFPFVRCVFALSFFFLLRLIFRFHTDLKYRNSKTQSTDFTQQALFFALLFFFSIWCSYLCKSILKSNAAHRQTIIALTM